MNIYVTLFDMGYAVLCLRDHLRHKKGKAFMTLMSIITLTTQRFLIDSMLLLETVKQRLGE